LSAEPNRCRKETAPRRARGPAPGLDWRNVCSTTRRKIWSTELATAESRLRKYLNRFGTD
jgi:hypothetical protein